MPDAYESSNIWRSTLATQSNDDHEEHRERLRSSYKQFRGSVEPLAGEIGVSMPHFTDHSITHVDALWDTASLILGTVRFTPMDGLRAMRFIPAA